MKPQCKMCQTQHSRLCLAVVFCAYGPQFISYIIICDLLHQRQKESAKFPRSLNYNLYTNYTVSIVKQQNYIGGLFLFFMIILQKVFIKNKEATALYKSLQIRGTGIPYFLLNSYVEFTLAQQNFIFNFLGINCEVNFDDCKNNPCVNGATCEDGLNSYVCRCKPGYTGEM